jgi:AraC-like DNA-binding protein
VVAVNAGGAHTSWYRGQTVTIPEHGIGVVNAGEIHTGARASSTPWQYRAFYPPTHLLAKVACDWTGRTAEVPAFPDAVIDDPELSARLLRAHRRCEAALDQLEIGSEIVAAFGLLVSRCADTRQTLPSPGREQAAVRRVREYLHANLAHAPHLEDLATLAGLSRFHLLRVFHRETGLPPHEYLTQLRIERAKHLLASGVAISNVAVAVGFSDQSHLTRRFKGLVGVTPGRFAAATRGQSVSF